MTNELMIAENTMTLAEEMEAPTQAFSSLKADTPEEKAKLFEVMNNPEKRLADCINMTINAKDIYVEVVDCTNEETGEVSKAPRCVIVDDKGIGYQCVSVGIFSALKKLIAIYGMPTWEQPIPVKVRQITKNTRKMMTLAVDYKK